MHIAVTGNIGAGKTTLVDLLARHYGWEPQFEAIDGNPYIEDFYQDMKRWSFNLQIYFLNTRFEHNIEIQKNEKMNIIQDRTIYEDSYIFADNLHEMALMSSRDYKNYQAIFNSIKEFIKPPDLLIYLKASVPTLVNQIQRRGREYEIGIRLDYLSKLNERYENWIAGYKESKLMTINVDKVNFVDDREELGKVIENINGELFGLFKS